MTQLIDFVLHIDSHLVNIVNQFGNWTYVILFAIIFVETGAVILPFLPGDSLLFAAAALAARTDNDLNVWLFAALFLIASIAGDSLNEQIGQRVGLAATKNRFFGKFINTEKIEEAQVFFDKYGGKTIAIGRFMPIIRTFVPFVAGGSQMAFMKFFRYDVIGSILWVTLCCGAGYFFGNITVVREHFSLVVLGIIGVSLIPMVITAVKSQMKKNNA
ncbi:VTT domain-containing protein [Latilactobacillus curvatus]|uniref:VTT domain-containing protein n=1 Tax=Latilactobacillus curvatus TaxID=28038 RepID=UPI0028BA4981|nr:VTT domain-containing protein [Latilactobacillus curvatus]MDT7017207.1 VTT domain-containing protein [Latilactobacillus curvatus]MDT7017496.1 VTT domain-containing protein [Latilactobacillus curvatus]